MLLLLWDISNTTPTPAGAPVLLVGNTSIPGKYATLFLTKAANLANTNVSIHANSVVYNITITVLSRFRPIPL